MSVCKIFTFEAAHYLPGYPGKCSNLHGHSWKLEVEVSGPIDLSMGFVMDFGDLKSLVEQKIIGKLDHTCLNEALKGEIEDSYGMVNPTCEHILGWVWEQIDDYRQTFEKLTWELERVRLYETPESFAELKIGFGEEAPLNLSKNCNLERGSNDCGSCRFLIDYDKAGIMCRLGYKVSSHECKKVRGPKPRDEI